MPTNKKTFGTSAINSPLPPLSLCDMPTSKLKLGWLQPELVLICVAEEHCGGKLSGGRSLQDLGNPVKKQKC